MKQRQEINALGRGNLKRTAMAKCDRKRGSYGTQQNWKSSCRYCARMTHGKMIEYPAYGKCCINCGGWNHFANVCNLRRRAVYSMEPTPEEPADWFSASEEEHFVSALSTQPESETLFMVDTLALDTIDAILRINGTPLQFLFQPETETSRTLRVCNDGRIRPVGQVRTRYKLS